MKEVVISGPYFPFLWSRDWRVAASSSHVQTEEEEEEEEGN